MNPDSHACQVMGIPGKSAKLQFQSQHRLSITGMNKGPDVGTLVGSTPSQFQMLFLFWSLLDLRILHKAYLVPCGRVEVGIAQNANSNRNSSSRSNIGTISINLDKISIYSVGGWTIPPLDLRDRP